MYLVSYDINKLKGRAYSRSDNYRLLWEFKESDMDCARVENYINKSARYCSTSLQQSIRRYNMSNTIKCILRKGEVFLIKVDKLKK